MPSFDTVSEVDMHEVTNAIDQAKREMGNRWDFKKVDSNIEFKTKDDIVILSAEEEFQLDQLYDILLMAFVKRKLDGRSLADGEDSKAGKQVKRSYKLRQGIDQPTAKKIVKMVKDAKLKVQASIQGDKVRMTGKKRDDLQEVMAFLREAELDVALQFDNFRD